MVFETGLVSQESLFGLAQDKRYMKMALRQAQKALLFDEVPVGAIVVNEQGLVVGRGYNQVMKQCSQRAHAEMVALSRAGKRIKDWRLNNCVLYVTLEPCPMCMAFAYLSRVGAIVYGATSPLFGYQRDLLDNEDLLRVYKKDVQIVSGILAEESVSLLKQFFQRKRRDGELLKGRTRKSTERAD